MVEQRTHNPLVIGSSPVRPTIQHLETSMEIIKVKEQTQIFGKYECLSRDQLLQLIDKSLAILPKECRASATFGIEEYHEEYDSNTYVAFFISWMRPETDKEIAARKKDQDALKLQVSKNEKAEYERLRKKFEAK